VRFFSTSGLPVEALKPVWTVADQPATNALDRPKFAVAVRLIQLLQNGQKGQGPTLEGPEGVVLRPAKFEGVSGVSVPFPPPEGGSTPAPGGQQQQHQAPPSPQQAPAQQHQHQQQYQGSTPPRPPHPAHQHPPPAGMATALTTQDPYTITPSEQSRYESIFQEHAKPDGFVYGGEAVALFSKSGMPQPQLAAIWNMVDSPIDNRLDKLEFCMAMHLIVCVSKKNLPLPPGLPVSLKLLKAQQQQQHQHQQYQQPSTAPSSPMQPGAPQPQLGAPPSPSSLPPPVVGIPSPPRQQQHPIQGGLTMPGPPPIQRTPSESTGMSSLPGPPPIQQPGGADIHDAFAGLSAGGDHGSAYMASQPMTMGFSNPADSGSAPSPSFHSVPAPASIPEPSPPAPAGVAAPASPPRVQTSDKRKSSYDMGEASEELAKLKATLQKLQAENISLKATMGSLSEEEKDVHKELNAVISEIGKLSSELTTLRAKVLASKSRLIEATAELKAAREKKS